MIHKKTRQAQIFEHEILFKSKRIRTRRRRRKEEKETQMRNLIIEETKLLYKEEHKVRNPKENLQNIFRRHKCGF